VAIIFFTIPRATIAQDTSSSPESSFEQVEQYLMHGDYDHAFNLLKELVGELEASDDVERLRKAYLQLIDTYVERGNWYRSNGQLENAALYRQQAREWVVKCLQTRELRDTYPENRLLYDQVMFDLFDDVRAELFGAFRVIELSPPQAFVTFDGDTLTAVPDGSISVSNIPGGEYPVSVSYDGYDTITDMVTIVPATTLERPYLLKKKRGFLWWTVWGAGVTAAVYGITTLVTGSSDSPTPTDSPLPEPPLPPN
jgi:hypothetical protein